MESGHQLSEYNETWYSMLYGTRSFDAWFQTQRKNDILGNSEIKHTYFAVAIPLLEHFQPLLYLLLLFTLWSLINVGGKFAIKLPKI